jgi:hypothetical protein
VFVKPGEAIKIFHHVGVLDLNNFNVHVVTRVTQQTRAQTPKGAQIRWVDITTWSSETRKLERCGKMDAR